MPQSIPSASAAKPRGRRRWNRARSGHAVDVGAVVGDDDDDDNSAAAVATSVLVLAGAVECILVPLMSGGCPTAGRAATAQRGCRSVRRRCGWLLRESSAWRAV